MEIAACCYLCPLGNRFTGPPHLYQAQFTIYVHGAALQRRHQRQKEDTPNLRLTDGESHQRPLQAISACTRYCGVYILALSMISMVALQFCCV